MNAIENVSNLHNQFEAQEFNQQQNVGGDQQGDYRTSMNKRQSDSAAEGGMESMRGKKKSKFNEQQQFQQNQMLQQQMQAPPEQYNRTKNQKFTPVFKNFPYSKNSHNVFDYINPLDKYRTWRDTHIDALECFSFFCQSLLANQTLQELKIGGVQYCDILIEELCATLSLMPSLKYLDLSNMSLDCLSWRCLSKYVGTSTILERINLWNNQITDECIRDFFNCFRNNTCLQELNLSECQIESSHVNILLRLLANNKSIRKVNLSYGTLNDENAEGIAEFLSNCVKIQLLDISNNSLGRSFFDRLNQNLSYSTHKKPKIQIFDIGSNVLNSNTYPNKVNGKEDSQKHSSKCIESLISILKKLKGVYRLNISNNFLETDDIRRLNIEANKGKRNLIVEELDLSFNYIDRNFPENFFQHLKSLNLKNNRLSLSSVEVIARTLKDEQTKWEVLDISENKINNSGLEILINYLKENNKLKELYCSDNEIEGVGMISIIINNERMNLNKIDLSQNKFTLNSIISYLNSLKNQSLSKIVLKNFDDVIKTTQKSHLINESKIIFDQPFSLDLQKSTILAQHVFKGFDRHLPKLNSLNVAYCTLGEEDMRRLSYLISNSHTLTHLNLEGITLGKFTEQCLTNLGNAFSENRCLKELNLSKCKLGTKFDKVAKDLGNINSLVELDISDNDLSDSIANILSVIIQKCFHLNHVNLSNNSVGNGCIHAIIRGLKGNSSLQKLTMSQTEVTAGELLSFSQLLQNCGHLKHLDISKNRLLDVNLITMNSLQLKPEKIVIEKKKIIDPYMATHLRLIMEDNNSTNLLMLNEMDIPKFYTSRILESITKMINLKKLSIKNPAKDNPIEASHLSKFFSLMLSMPSLVKISFSNLKMTPEHFTHLATLLATTTTLKTLFLCEEKINTQAMTSLTIGLAKNKTLAKLKLVDSDITSAECQILASALVHHPALVQLNLNLNSISSEGITYLMTALQNIKTFKQFHFCEAKETDGPALTKILTEVNSNFKYLTLLNVSYNSFNSDDFSPVLRELKNHESLIHINLSGNPINDKGAEELKIFLTENTKLKQLVLRSCGLELQGFQQISQGVSQNEVLEMLDLSNNQVGDDAFYYFTTLVYPKSLKLFIISGNKITQQGNHHLHKFMKSCPMKLFIVNDWEGISDDIAIELLNNLIIQHSRDHFIPNVPRHYYTCIDFKRGQLTDKFCLFFTENFQKLRMLECLNLEKNYHITQTGMKHVFTAVYDNRKNFDLNLIFLNFSQREDDLATQRHKLSSSSQEKNKRKTQSLPVGGQNSNQIKAGSSDQVGIKRKERSIWQKVTLYFQRKLQFINDKITSQHEYKFDYCNLEKINLLKYQNLLILLLAGSFVVQIIISAMPFISQAITIRSIILAVSLFILLCEFISYCMYLYYVNMSEDIDEINKLNFINKLQTILSKIKYFDIILLVRGLARRADFILTNYIAIFYFVNNLTYLQEVYILFLVIKGLVILFFALSPCYDWCFKKRSFSYSKDKQFLDVGERLSMVFGMSMVEQIFQLFNPGASSVVSFQIKKQSQRKVFNIWNKKVYEYIYLTFYITPLLVLYALFYYLFTHTYEKQILQLAFAVLGICFILSIFTILTTRPTYIQQADFNEILNYRKFTQIEKSRSRQRSSTIRQTLFENMKQRNYSQESYFAISSNYTKNTQFRRLIREEIITADINFNDPNKPEEGRPLLPESGSNKGIRILDIMDIQESNSSIPPEYGDQDNQVNRETHNQVFQLKKIKNE